MKKDPDFTLPPSPLPGDVNEKSPVMILRGEFAPTADRGSIIIQEDELKQEEKDQVNRPVSGKNDKLKYL